MAKPLNFNKVKKEYLPVTLPDENETVLLIGTPTKAVFDEFTDLKDKLDSSMGDDALDEIYSICARIMSYNKGGIKITKEHISECMDFQDVIIFIHAYTDFITEVSNQKNS